MEAFGVIAAQCVYVAYGCLAAGLGFLGVYNIL